MSRTDDNKSVSRREALMTIGVAGGAAVVAVSATTPHGLSSGPGTQTAKTATQSTTSTPVQTAVVAQPDETTRALFAPIQAHGRVGDCRLVAVHAVTMGAIPVVLATADGAQFQVDVLRHDTGADGVNGVRTAGSLTVALHNEGEGDASTHEARGLGAMALLEVLAAREAEGAAVPALLTLRARVQRFPRGVLGVLSIA